jgi:HicA toxin of bacterial toxin-antitoxin,
MKRRQFEQHLRSHGCYLDREGGDHSWWAAPGGKPRAAVPRHREVKWKLARKVCKDLGVPAPEGGK